MGSITRCFAPSNTAQTTHARQGPPSAHHLLCNRPAIVPEEGEAKPISHGAAALPSFCTTGFILQRSQYGCSVLLPSPSPPQSSQSALCNPAGNCLSLLQFHAIKKNKTPTPSCFASCNFETTTENSPLHLLSEDVRPSTFAGGRCLLSLK